MEGIRRFINRSDSLNSKSHARIGGALRLVKHNKRRVIIGFRTMMSTVVCLVISYYYEWSGVGTFLSGVISAITGSKAILILFYSIISGQSSILHHRYQDHLSYC